MGSLQFGMPRAELTADLLQVLDRAAELTKHPVAVRRCRHRLRGVGERAQTLLNLSRDFELSVVLVCHHFLHLSLSCSGVVEDEPFYHDRDAGTTSQLHAEAVPRSEALCGRG